MRPARLLPALTVLLTLACDPRAWLAQSDLFADLRDELVLECCACLAHRGTHVDGATCAVPQLSPDGGVVFPADGGSIIAPDAGALDDFNDTVDPDEVPCLCLGDYASCRETLRQNGIIHVSGACLQPEEAGFQGDPGACYAECRGVLRFDPVRAQATGAPAP